MTIQPTETCEVNSLVKTSAAVPGVLWHCYLVENDGSEYHNMPVLDIMEHRFDACGCEPVSSIDDDGDLIVSHNAWDGRDYLDAVGTPEERTHREAAWYAYLDEQGVLPQYWELVHDADSLEEFMALSGMESEVFVPAEDTAEPVKRSRDLGWTLDMARCIAFSPTSFRSRIADLHALAKLFILNGDRDSF